jgi:hypothetical protein
MDRRAVRITINMELDHCPDRETTQVGAEWIKRQKMEEWSRNNPEREIIPDTFYMYYCPTHSRVNNGKYDFSLTIVFYHKPKNSI